MKHGVWLFVILVASPAFAQKVTVKRVKGTQAIVEVMEGAMMVGKTYDLGPMEGVRTGDLEFTASATGPRKNYLRFAAELSSIRTESGTSSSTKNLYSVAALYGWNKGITEFGAGGLLIGSDTGNGLNWDYGVLGNFDFNFGANKPGVSSLFGAGIEAAYVIFTAASGGGGANRINLFPSVYMKWFPLRSSVSLRADLGYRYNQNTGSAITNNKSTDSGLAITGGLQVYF